MSKYVVLHDRRLQGGVPPRAGLSIVKTDGATPLGRAFQVIKAVAGSGRVDTLFVLCHGYAGTNDRARVCGDFGGMGLQLGKENVLHANVSMWASISDKVENVVVYACGSADTQPGNEGTSADGRYLMGALAIHTNADVFAADRIQWYSTYQGLTNGRFDFGAWEGQLWHFPPNGMPAGAVSAAPVDLADVFAGTALRDLAARRSQIH